MLAAFGLAALHLLRPNEEAAPGHDWAENPMNNLFGHPNPADFRQTTHFNVRREFMDNDQLPDRKAQQNYFATDKLVRDVNLAEDDRAALERWRPHLHDADLPLRRGATAVNNYAHHVDKRMPSMQEGLATIYQSPYTLGMSGFSDWEEDSMFGEFYQPKLVTSHGHANFHMPWVFSSPGTTPDIHKLPAVGFSA